METKTFSLDQFLGEGAKIMKQGIPPLPLSANTYKLTPEQQTLKKLDQHGHFFSQLYILV